MHDERFRPSTSPEWQLKKRSRGHAAAPTPAPSRLRSRLADAKAADATLSDRKPPWPPVPQEANPEASQQEHEEQSELRLARPMTAAVPGDLNSELESRPMTATCPQPFSFASTAIMMRSRERTARKAREREEELKAQSRFKARPPPKEIYGDQIERAQLKRMHAESAEERARREAEELARLTKTLVTV